MNGSICTACLPPCKTCTSAAICQQCTTSHSLFGAGECLPACPDGYASVNKVCVSCSSNCQTCSVQVNYCDTCIEGSYLLEGACMNPCPSAYYESDVSGTCEECPFECSSCQDQQVCYTCLGGYKFHESNSTCSSMCQSGQVPIDAICQSCSLGCEACIYVQTNCSSCLPAYYYLNAIALGTGDINYCYEACPPIYFYYPTTMQCLWDCPSSTYYLNTTK